MFMLGAPIESLASRILPEIFHLIGLSRLDNVLYSLHTILHEHVFSEAGAMFV